MEHLALECSGEHRQHTYGHEGPGSDLGAPEG